MILTLISLSLSLCFLAINRMKEVPISRITRITFPKNATTITILIIVTGDIVTGTETIGEMVTEGRLEDNLHQDECEDHHQMVTIIGIVVGIVVGLPWIVFSMSHVIAASMK